MKISNLPMGIMLLFLSAVLLISCVESEDNEETNKEENTQNDDKEEENNDDDNLQIGEAPDISVLKDLFYSDNVEFVVGTNTITITTKDLPDHKSVYYPSNDPLYEEYSSSDDPDFQKNPGEIQAQNVTMTIPRYPAEASSHSSPGLGPMGVAINSVVFFNQQAAPDDDIFDEIKTFDQFEGHPAGTQYHYHNRSSLVDIF